MVQNGLQDSIYYNFIRYSKHPHIRTHDFRVQADLVLCLFIGHLARNQPEDVLNMFLNFVSEILDITCY